MVRANIALLNSEADLILKQGNIHVTFGPSIPEYVVLILGWSYFQMVLGWESTVHNMLVKYSLQKWLYVAT